MFIYIIYIYILYKSSDIVLQGDINRRTGEENENGQKEGQTGMLMIIGKASKRYKVNIK